MTRISEDKFYLLYMFVRRKRSGAKWGLSEYRLNHDELVRILKHPDNRLLLWEMQRTAVGMSTVTDGSLELRRMIYLQLVVGMKPNNQTSPIATSCKW